jgi:N-formylglutamate deformylase
MQPIEVKRGDGPLILGQPHGGIHVPDEILIKLNVNGRKLADTDWHIGKLYDGLLPDMTVVSATFHRYVIDANRDPSGISLYPGQNTTSLCPLTDFDGQLIYQNGQEPDAKEVDLRRAKFHAPYHAALAAEVERVKAKHGFAIVYDCHSIRSRIPFLFEGTLPDLNIGTDNGKTCAPEIERLTTDLVKAAPFTSVLNGRFRGGWTTRHYGQPHSDVHAIQMEIAQSAYLETEAPPWAFSASKTAKLRPILKTIFTALEGFKP